MNSASEARFFFFTLLITCTWSWWGRESIKKTIRQIYSSNQRSGLQSKIKKKKKKKILAKPKTEQVQRPMEKRHWSRVPTRSEPYICLHNELSTSSLLPQQYTIKIINKIQFFCFFYNPPKHAHSRGTILTAGFLWGALISQCQEGCPDDPIWGKKHFSQSKSGAEWAKLWVKSIQNSRLCLNLLKNWLTLMRR